jgi:hypothetical protein
MPHTDHVHLIRWTLILAVVTVATSLAADRKWETGTLVDIATKRSPWVRPSSSGTDPFQRGPTKSVMSEVPLYVIETKDRRLTLNKKTAYIRLPDGNEYRLRLVKNEPRTTK